MEPVEANFNHSSLSLSDQMDVERQQSPQSCVGEDSPQTGTQEGHSTVMEQRKEKKYLIIAEQNSTLTKDPQSPATTLAATSPNAKLSEATQEMPQIVLISDNRVVQVSKDGHLMPPSSPVRTPQATPPTTSESDHSVRALVVYNENPIMKEESYPITCGNSKGDIYWKKFVCPGINAKCVKCNGQWLTPKEFVQEAGKMTLKDWKRAIRINGTMLRKLIESGEVDYYQHDTNCSNQCRSNKGPSLDSNQGSFNHSFEIDSAKEHAMEISALERSNSEESPNYMPTKRTTFTHKISQESTKSVVSSLERSSSEDSGLAPSPQLDGVIMRESIATAEKVQDLQTFWSGIIRSELFDEVIQEILQQVSSMHSRAKSSPIVTAEDAVTLTNVANALEMVPGILQKTATQKISIERQSEQTTHIIQDLERQLAEQKKYDHDLKRKSQVLDAVIKVTANEKRKRPKMVRLYRQKAVDRPTTAQHQSTPNGQVVASVSRITTPDMTSVMTNPLMRYSGQEIWGTQSGSVAHVLQAATTHIPGHNIMMPLPPQLLQATRESTPFQVHQDTSKK